MVLSRCLKSLIAYISHAQNKPAICHMPGTPLPISGDRFTVSRCLASSKSCAVTNINILQECPLISWYSYPLQMMVASYDYTHAVHIILYTAELNGT